MAPATVSPRRWSATEPALQRARMGCGRRLRRPPRRLRGPSWRSLVRICQDRCQRRRDRGRGSLPGWSASLEDVTHCREHSRHERSTTNDTTAGIGQAALRNGRTCGEARAEVHAGDHQRQRSAVVRRGGSRSKQSALHGHSRGHRATARRCGRPDRRADDRHGRKVFVLGRHHRPARGFSRPTRGLLRNVGAVALLRTHRGTR